MSVAGSHHKSPELKTMLNRQVLIRNGMGCSMRTDCFTCPPEYADCCKFEPWQDTKRHEIYYTDGVIYSKEPI